MTIITLALLVTGTCKGGGGNGVQDVVRVDGRMHAHDVLSDRAT